MMSVELFLPLVCALQSFVKYIVPGRLVSIMNEFKMQLHPRKTIVYLTTNIASARFYGF